MASQKEKLPIKEPEFLIDYFRFASRINGLAAIANYRAFESSNTTYDKRGLFVAQNALLLSSIEDFALFLNICIESKNLNLRLLSLLAKGDESKTNLPPLLQKPGEAFKFLSHLNLSRDALIEIHREVFKISKSNAKKIIDTKVEALRDAIRWLSKVQKTRNKAYNKTKHGKPILSVSVEKLDTIETATEAEGPIVFHTVTGDEKGGPNLKGEILPYSDEQMKNFTLNIIGLSDAIRDLIFLFILQHHKPVHKYFFNVVRQSPSLRTKVLDLDESAKK